MCLEVLGQWSKTSWMIKQDFLGLNIFFRIRINSYSLLKCRECSHGMREVLSSNPGRTFYSPAPLPSDIWLLSVGPCSDCEQQKDSLVSWVPAWFRANSGIIYLSRGKLSRVYSLARVLAWYGRAPGLESQSGHVLFPPLWHLFHDQFRCRSHRNKHHHPGFGASIQKESHRSRCQNRSGVVTRIVTFFLFK